MSDTPELAPARIEGPCTCSPGMECAACAAYASPQPHGAGRRHLRQTRGIVHATCQRHATYAKGCNACRVATQRWRATHGRAE
jgi:hypothetical protein